ncbi:MAG: hypothetical protein ACOWWM_18565 [Desulfobacterales bacterium]
MENPELPMDESLYDEINRKDSYQILLVELLHLLGSNLRSKALDDGGESSTAPGEEAGLIGRPFQNLGITLKKLAAIPGGDGQVLIRARVPFEVSRDACPPDYEVRFSDMAMDRPAVAGMIERLGERMGYLTGLMDRAFAIFDKLSIACLYMRMPEDTAEAYDDLRTSIHILSQYPQAIASGQPIQTPRNGREVQIPLVYNESGLPDVNLTMLAGLNDLSPGTMQKLVQEVGEWMRSSEASAGAHRYASVYNAISGTRGADEKFKNPPVEVNNLKWLLIEKGDQKLSKSKAQLARVLLEMPDPSPLNQILYLQSIYGMDYPRLSPSELAMRLDRISELLGGIGDRPKRELVMEEILGNLQWRLDKVSDAVYDGIHILNSRLTAETGEGPPIAVELRSRTLSHFLGFFKRRSGTRKKMRRIGDRDLVFDSGDFEIIAREFDISPVDAKEILEVVKRCFDAAGHFVKGAFESSLEDLSRFEEKAFEILWHYLKEPLSRDDRLAFLNAVQLFFVRLRRPERALNILLEDFMSETQLVRYSDRNSMMLATLLLRKYNKELEIDIEITPEEVFLVRDGLNREVATTALHYVDTHKEALIEKIRTIHRRVFESMDPATAELVGMTPKYLLSLEREIHIFLALLGGDIARSILRGALNAYGNPENELYRLAATDRLRQALIQHLKVLLRALGRAGDPSDLPLVEQIIGQRDAFLELSRESRYGMLVHRAMEYAEKAGEEMKMKRPQVLFA